uniref:Uncharacterized protein n=1 Tax=Sinocyclocheilus anshuiensis TaxID=1608454 RepID=A0A671SNC6_9TELE
MRKSKKQKQSNALLSIKTGASVILLAQLFGVIFRIMTEYTKHGKISSEKKKMTTNLNIHCEDPVSTKIDHRELHKANISERMHWSNADIYDIHSTYCHTGKKERKSWQYVILGCKKTPQKTSGTYKLWPIDLPCLHS